MRSENSLNKLTAQIQKIATGQLIGAISIDEGKAKIWWMLGRALHAVYGNTLEGDAAIAAAITLCRQPAAIEWLDENPNAVTVSMSTNEILDAIAKEATGTPSDATPEAPEPSEPLSLPPLPAGVPIFSGAPATAMSYQQIVGSLDHPALIRMDAPGIQAAATVVRGHTNDAIWMDRNSVKMGRGAVSKIEESPQGQLSASSLDEDILDVLPLLWRIPVSNTDIPTDWIDVESFVEWLAASGGVHVFTVRRGEHTLVAFITKGTFVGMYTSADPSPRHNMDELRSWFGPRGRLTMRHYPPIQTVGDESLPEAPQPQVESTPPEISLPPPPPPPPSTPTSVFHPPQEAAPRKFGVPSFAKASVFSSTQNHLPVPQAKKELTPSKIMAPTITPLSPKAQVTTRMEPLPTSPNGTSTHHLTIMREIYSTAREQLEKSGVDPELASSVLHLFEQTGSTAAGIQQGIDNLNWVVPFGVTQEAVENLHIALSKIAKEYS